MALKKFNYKLKENKKKPLIISGIIVLVLLVGVTIYNTYAAYKATTSYNILQGKIEFFEKRDITIAVKLVDDEGNVTHSEDFPTEGYTFDPVKSYCVNGAKVSYSNGSASITEVKGKEKCTLYFNEYGALAQAIFTNNTIVTTTPDFSQAATDTNTNIYKTEDDFGASYYFRGAATNNYVQFGAYASGTTINVMDSDSFENTEVTFTEATPIYWRIVRINGDGTIRLVYDGTAKVENGVTHRANVGMTAYNTENPLNVNYGDSDVKGVVDTWYNTHLKTNYGEFIADGIFCNDKKVSEYYDYEYENDIYYASHIRLYTNKNPQLACTRLEDRYTKTTKLGNGQLTHPVGLLTADEAYLAGGAKIINNTYYLYSGEYSLTSTPYYSAYDMEASVWAVNAGGDVREDGLVPSGELYSARPVINLKANVSFTGNGSFETPFVIQTN